MRNAFAPSDPLPNIDGRLASTSSSGAEFGGGSAGIGCWRGARKADGVDVGTSAAGVDVPISGRGGHGEPKVAGSIPSSRTLCDVGLGPATHVKQVWWIKFDRANDEHKKADPGFSLMKSHKRAPYLRSSSCPLARDTSSFPTPVREGRPPAARSAQ